MKLSRHIPNLLTLSNLLCGCLAIGLVIGPKPNLLVAAVLVLLAAVFDFLDGFAARMLRVTSPIGKELDSLADMVTFGLVPALFAQKLLIDSAYFETRWPLYIPLLIALLSALRLAIFNVDTRQVSGFIGMPTPANALLWISFPLVAATGEPTWWISPFLDNGWAILALSVVSALLLVSPLPLMALKFKSYGWRGNQQKFILVAASLVLLLIFHFAAIPIILILYIILSILFRPKSYEI